MGNIPSSLEGCFKPPSGKVSGDEPQPGPISSEKWGLFKSSGDPQSRCYMMYKEAKEYDKQVLSPAVKNLRALLEGAETVLTGTQRTMEGHLPNVYEERKPKPCTRKAVGGAGFQQETVQATKRDLLAKLEAEVFGPLHRWSMKLAAATQRQRTLDRAYDEMEKWRREAEQARTKVRGVEDEGMAVKKAKMEDHLKEMERNAAASMQEHERTEAKQFEELQELNNETMALRNLIRRGLTLVEEALAGLREAVPTSDIEANSQREDSLPKEVPAADVDNKGAESAGAGAENPREQLIPAHTPAIVAMPVVPMPVAMPLQSMGTMPKPAPLEKVSPIPVPMGTMQ